MLSTGRLRRKLHLEVLIGKYITNLLCMYLCMLQKRTYMYIHQLAAMCNFQHLPMPLSID